MTVVKPRPPLTYAEAITRIMGAIGADEAGRVVGKTGSLVRAWADPDRDCYPDIEQCELLDRAYVEATGLEAPILEVFAQRVGKPKTQSGCDPLLRLAKITTEVGHLAAEVQSARDPTSPGGATLTPNEVSRIGTEAQHIMDVVQALVRDISHA